MIGIDIVSIKRFENFLKKFGQKALERFLCEEEIVLVKSNTTAAGFFAAKEAVSKALGTGIGKELGFYDIKICKDEKGAPYFTLSKKVIQIHCITDTALSITHDGDFAVAVAVIESLHKNRQKKLFH